MRFFGTNLLQEDSALIEAFLGRLGSAGRLTLTSGTPVLTADVAATGTVYFTPYLGSMIPLYDGTRWRYVPFSQLSNVLADSTTNKAGPAAAGNGKVNDLFVWDDGGTLRLTRGPDWTSDLARSAGTALVLTNGIYLNNALITNGPAASRGTYVGTIRTEAGSAQVSLNFGGAAAGGTAAWFGLWNMFNRVPGAFMVRDSTSSWSNSGTTTRSLDGSTANRVTMVRGLDEDAVQAFLTCDVKSSASSSSGYIAIGLDATNAAASRSVWGTTSNTLDLTLTAQFAGLPGLGVHYLQALEAASANTITFFGAAAGYNGLCGIVRY